MKTKLFMLFTAMCFTNTIAQRMPLLQYQAHTTGSSLPNKLTREEPEALPKDKDLYERQILSVVNKIILLQNEKKRYTDSIIDSSPTNVEESLKKSDSYIAQCNKEIRKYEILRKSIYTKRVLNSVGYPCLMKAKKINYDTLNHYLFGEETFALFENFSFTTGNASLISVEFISAYFKAFRVGIAGQFNSSGDTIQDNKTKSSLQNILMYGGDLSVNVSAPFFYIGSRTHEIWHIMSFLQINNGLGNVKSAVNSTSTEELTFNQQVGITLHGDITANNNKMAVAADLPFFYSWNSPVLYKQLDTKDYFVLQLRISLIIAGLGSFNVTGPLWSSSDKVQRVPFTAGLQFSPSQIIKKLK